MNSDYQFKGTKGKLEPKYVSGVCIGIGTVGEYAIMTANSILDIEDLSDKEIESQLNIIDADMLLYSKAPEMLEFLQKIVSIKSPLYTVRDLQDKASELIKSATELKEDK